MSDKQKLEYSGRVDVEQLATYLSALSDALRRGTLKLSVGEQSVTLEPKGIVRVEIEAARDLEKGRGSLELELTWHEELEAAAADLEISAGGPDEPDAPEVPAEVPASAAEVAPATPSSGESNAGESRRRGRDAASASAVSGSALPTVE